MTKDQAPVWLGEFGTNGPEVTDKWWFEIGEVAWWHCITKMIQEESLDFAYWAFNGQKHPGEEETFGLLRADYVSLRQPTVLRDIQNL
eukprot:gnl/TRDRNA2_/TRDRNA2_87784_c1_seq1.p1 gnl/TRDRNA2_/TRDRNA2_87784_c1~~gnl/TRDRNA2_/TRDRNA2_87784_c1_seq1.p1  ORF type:complete len:100 (-),score=19.58 gnl/TRDRNA2_/TRDRNA2_87784_c1_seq1:63-326(-)